MTTTRIYRIAPADGQGNPRLVRATHPATALRHVAADAFEVRVASQDDLLTAFEAGVKVESIAAEPVRATCSPRSTAAPPKTSRPKPTPDEPRSLRLLGAVADVLMGDRHDHRHQSRNASRPRRGWEP